MVHLKGDGLDMVCKNGMLTSGIVRWNDDNEDSKYRGQSDVETIPKRGGAEVCYCDVLPVTRSSRK